MQKILILGFVNGRVFYDKHNSLPISATNIGNAYYGNDFKPDVFWKLRITNYREGGRVYAEILSYTAGIEEFDSLEDFPYPVSEITIRHIDTISRIKSLRSSSKPKSPRPQKPLVTPPPPEPLVLKKEVVRSKLEVPWTDLTYHDGFVTFSVLLLEGFPPTQIRIENPNIRKEFDSVAEYLGKALGKSAATIEIWAEKETDQHGKIHTFRLEKASSKDIDAVGTQVVEDVQCNYAVATIFDKKAQIENPHGLKTPESFLGEILGPGSGKTAPTADTLLEKAFAFKKAKHYQHLTYLSKRHCGKRAILRFTFSPFAFLFLLEGKTRSFFVLETYDAKLATYVWACQGKGKEGARDRLGEIERLLPAFEESNRREYVATKPEGFHRATHNYRDTDGFDRWRDEFEKILASEEEYPPGPDGQQLTAN